MNKLGPIMMMVNNISNAIKTLSNLQIEHRSRKSKSSQKAMEHQQDIVCLMINDVNEQIMLEKLYNWNV